MGLDYAYAVCAGCGKGFDYTELAQNQPEGWKHVDIWALRNGPELQPYLQKLWVPLCPECGGDKFYPLLNSDEVVEYLEEMLADGALIGEEERGQAEALLAVWQQRMQEEDNEWRKNVAQDKQG